MNVVCMKQVWRAAFCIAVVMASVGCTAESLRVALEAQRRADQVQQFVFDKQHDGLNMLLYRDLVHGINAEQDEPMSAARLASLNNAWNERDLIEFWRVQHERAKALRLVGVDAKLAADQSVIDLLVKSLDAKVARVQDAIAAQAGASLDPAPATEPETDPTPDTEPAPEPNTVSGSDNLDPNATVSGS